MTSSCSHEIHVHVCCTLTHPGRLTQIHVSKVGHNWFRYWPGAFSPTIRYLNQCWNIVNWTFRRQSIIWTNAVLLLTGPFGTNISDMSLSCQWNHNNFNTKLIWKCRLQICGPFVSCCTMNKDNKNMVTKQNMMHCPCFLCVSVQVHLNQIFYPSRIKSI